MYGVCVRVCVCAKKEIKNKNRNSMLATHFMGSIYICFFILFIICKTLYDYMERERARERERKNLFSLIRKIRSMNTDSIYVERKLIRIKIKTHLCN
jgi:p-aminobenzoyl-glutamate transporter AbgT